MYPGFIGKKKRKKNTNKNQKKENEIDCHNYFPMRNIAKK